MTACGSRHSYDAIWGKCPLRTICGIAWSCRESSDGPPHHSPSFWLLAASALTASVIAAAWGYYPRLVSLKELESLASARSSQENPQLEFQSDRPSDIQLWIRKRAGFDIPLLGRPNVSIQMIGANVIDPSTPIVEVRSGVVRILCCLLPERDSVLPPA